jgi:hypothetical protein
LLPLLLPSVVGQLTLQQEAAAATAAAAARLPKRLRPAVLEAADAVAEGQDNNFSLSNLVAAALAALQARLTPEELQQLKQFPGQAAIAAEYHLLGAEDDNGEAEKKAEQVSSQLIGCWCIQEHTPLVPSTDTGVCSTCVSPPTCHSRQQ